MSLPTPKREPPAPIKLDSPPLLPPGVRSGFRQFLVTPKTGFWQPNLVAKKRYMQILNCGSIQKWKSGKYSLTTGESEVHLFYKMVLLPNP